jgi:hypothetical protein
MLYAIICEIYWKNLPFKVTKTIEEAITTNENK